VAPAQARPKQTSAQYGLANIDSLLQAAEPEQALAQVRVLWERLGTDPVYGWQIEGRLGLALLISGRADEAIPHLENMVRRQPGEAAHHRNLATALWQLNRRGRALSEYSFAVEADPADPDLRREYGQVLLSFGDLDNAESALELAAKLCDQCPAVDEPLAELYLQQGRYEDALPVLMKLYEKTATPAHRRSLVVALSQVGDDARLLEFIEQGDVGERSAEEWHLMIEAEGRLGEAVHARALLDELLDELPGNAPPAPLVADHRFWAQIALNLLQADDAGRGLRAIDHALTLAPNNVIYLNNRVVLLLRLGRQQEAKSAWAEVLRLDPDRSTQLTEEKR